MEDEMDGIPHGGCNWSGCTTCFPSRDVHTTHCCSRHGCKYGDPDCTVVTGRAPQQYMDEWCALELEEGGLETAYLMNEMYDKGRASVR